MPKIEQESHSLPATTNSGDFPLGSLHSSGAARAMLEGERTRTDQVDCYACMWAGFPMREHPEVKDAHWDEERNVFKSLLLLGTGLAAGLLRRKLS
jgi:hypothetical protein